MDNFDKLIQDKINQTELPNSNEAWNDFLNYKAKKETPKGGFRFSKIALFSIVAVLLISSITLTGIYLNQPKNIAIQSKAIENQKSTKSETSNNAIEQKEINKPSVNKEISQPSLIQVENQNIESKQIIKEKSFTPKVQKAIPVKEPVTNISVTNNGIENSSIQAPEIKNTTISTLITTQPVVDKKNETINDVDPYSFIENQGVSTVQSTTVETSPVKTTKEITANNQTKSEVKTQSEQNTSQTNKTEATVPSSQNKTSTTKTPPQVTSLPNASGNPEVGNVKKAKKFSYKDFVSTFNHYTDVSLYNLENSREIASILNAQFILNPANSGYENRYSFFAGAKGDFNQSKPAKSLVNESSQLFLANSFVLVDNKIGIGMAINKFKSSAIDALNIYISSAYNIELSKNQHLRVGFGIDNCSSSIISTDNGKYDAGYTSLQLGVRYMYKTLFAELYMNNAYTIFSSSNKYEIDVPTIYHTNFGGRLFLTKTWAIHPGLNLSWNSTTKDFTTSPIVSLSFRNKWLMGLQTDNFKSIGIHAGLYANRRFTVLLKSDIYSSRIPNSSFFQTGEVVLKLELGQIRN